VWCSATSWSKAEQKIEQAAVMSFVPFASASRSPAGGTVDGLSGADTYVQAYEEFVGRPVSTKYVRAKIANAAGSLNVATSGPPADWQTDMTVTVEYLFPFHIPGIGRLIGQQGSDGGYYFPLKSEATLQNEGPRNDSQTLGIGYGTLP
jgi:pectate lyase